MRSFSIIILSLLGTAATVAAECCSSPATCLDGTKSDIWSCCAYGSCNIFCCNCDGGCRQASTKRSWTDWVSHDLGNLASDSEGTSVCGLTRTDKQCVIDKINELDTDLDGKVSLAEILANPDIVRPGLSTSGIDDAELHDMLTKLFDIYDTSEDGYLVFDEANTRQVVHL
ncbi:hypothetical protein LTR84_008258 [Exophiala bonariae]|uniref:EF-hand domain-containing protein n=1 Tax=Exophiala bonariae TaxID=1690606 RepID=A0AAV9N0E1_9EURO|nr:hypothetical protein LTR84_008258 [Exophiala bonariae]